MLKYVALAIIMCCAVNAASDDHSSCAVMLASSNVEVDEAFNCFDKLVSDHAIWEKSLAGYYGDAAWNVLKALRQDNLVEKFVTGQMDNVSWVRGNFGNIQGLDTDACGDFKTANDVYSEYLQRAIAGSNGERTIVDAIRASDEVAACVVMQEACIVVRM